MARFRKKPVVIEAVQFTGQNGKEVCDFAGLEGVDVESAGGKHVRPFLIIPTLEGNHRADVGDWIIKGVAGEFYPCKPDIFAATYEPVATIPT